MQNVQKGDPVLELQLKTSWSYKGQRGNETFFHTAIGNFMTAMRDWAPGFRAMADEVLEPEVRKTFETAGYGEWTDLAESTIRNKERRGLWGGRLGILTDSGYMAKSFTLGGSDHVEEINRQSMRWGSRVPHALFHQTGTGSGFGRQVKGSGRGLPMRKIINLPKMAKRAMRSIMVRRLATIARREGFGIGSGISPDVLTARRIGQIALGLE